MFLIVHQGHKNFQSENETHFSMYYQAVISIAITKLFRPLRWPKIKPSRRTSLRQLHLKPLCLSTSGKIQSFTALPNSRLRVQSPKSLGWHKSLVQTKELCKNAIKHFCAAMGGVMQSPRGCYSLTLEKGIRLPFPW